jgi:hypothetical protein
MKDDWTEPDDDRGQALTPASDDGPRPLIAGTFAVYEAPDGGYVLVTDTPRGVDRKVISGRMVKLGGKLLGGMLG